MVQTFWDIDLVLNERSNTGGSNISFDGPLRDALRDRAACDSMRSLHLRTEERALPTHILSKLTPDDEDVRGSSIELITSTWMLTSFLRYRFPKLRYLDLSTSVTISSWEAFGLCITALTALSLSTTCHVFQPRLFPSSHSCSSASP